MPGTGERLVELERARIGQTLLSLTEETVAALTYVGRASTNFCCGLEPSLPKHVMGSEALFCPHMGLPLEGPLRAGFSLGAALP